MVSSDKDQEKKKIPEVKTFAVPFALEENQGNLTINTNTSSKPSKKQIINQAFKFHSQGNISEATKLYQYFIDQGYKDHQVFSNYGVILKSLGKFQEAEIAQRKAIEHNPDFADAHSNLGVLLRDLGKLQDAELSYRKAIKLNPDFVNAHYNLGVILLDLGKLQDAELSLRKAIELKPDFAEAYHYLGNILNYLGKLKELSTISEDILESNSINIGGKLLASLKLCTVYLIQGDQEKTLLNIRKSIELINKGGLSFIKDERTRTLSLTRILFISSLYPLLKKDNQNTSFGEILHIGESHSLSFAHQTISISSKLKKIQPVFITGGKAWHFANNKKNQWKSSLNEQIQKYTDTEEVFISFGEIDCRKGEGILYYTVKQDKDISEVCEKTINGYLSYMERTLSPYYSKRYYFGIPAPTIIKELQDELDIKRIQIIRLYNSILKKEVLSRGSYLLDVYTLTSTKEGINNNLHMCDKFHLSPKCLSILFERHLLKP